MAKNPDRIPLYSALAQSYDEKPIRWLKIFEAFQLLRLKQASVQCAYCGQSAPRTSVCKQSPNRQHWMFAKLCDPRKKDRFDKCALTMSDMEQNAAAVEENRPCRSRTKVEEWPRVYDTHAVTVVAGRRIFIPDPEAAGDRVRRMREARA